jgi:hypothetical protein
MSFRDKIKELKKREDTVIKRAYADTPEKYHCFIRLLEQNQKVAGKQFDISDDLEELGVFPYKNGMYLRLKEPYVVVDGRVQMAVDEAIEKGETVEIGPPEFHEVSGELLCTMKVKTARGTAYGTAKVGVGGMGVDSTNPFENAQTSAVGRALAFLGYGLIGTGIASAEEVEGAVNGRKQMQNINESNSTEAEDSGQKETIEGDESVSDWYTLMGARVQEKDGKKLWIIAVQQGEKSFPMVVNPEIDFEAMNLQKGEALEISVAKRGNTYFATDIKRARQKEAV